MVTVEILEILKPGHVILPLNTVESFCIRRPKTIYPELQLDCEFLKFKCNALYLDSFLFSVESWEATKKLKRISLSFSLTAAFCFRTCEQAAMHCTRTGIIDAALFVIRCCAESFCNFNNWEKIRFFNARV